MIGDIETPTVCARWPHLFDDRPAMTAHDVAELRAMCAACPVLEQCRTVAMTSAEVIGGFVAGMTERQRRRARLNLGVAAYLPGQTAVA